MLVFFIIIGIIGAMSIVGMISSSQATQTVTDNSVLVLNLSGEMNEQAGDNVFGQLTGNVYNNQDSKRHSPLLRRRRKMRKSKGIYIEAGAFGSDFLPQELRNTLLDFKKSGKWIIALMATHTLKAHII